MPVPTKNKLVRSRKKKDADLARFIDLVCIRFDTAVIIKQDFRVEKLVHLVRYPHYGRGKAYQYLAGLINYCVDLQAPVL